MSIFWGLNMKPNRKYSQTIGKSFHISGITLDEGERAKFYLTADKQKYCVAHVTKDQPQTALDLNISKGDKIVFQTVGDATVSLLGYLHSDVDSDDDDFDEDIDPEEYAKLVKTLSKKGGKAGGKAENDEDDEEEEGDDDDDDDEDVDDEELRKQLTSYTEDDDEEDSDDEDGEDDEEDEDDDDEEDDEDDNEDSDDEEVQQPKAKQPKLEGNAKKQNAAKEQNGVAKKEEKKKSADGKQKQQQQEQQSKQKEPKAAPAGGERTLSGGVKVEDVRAGNGAEAKSGKRVSVYYIGRLKSNNKTFDSMQKGNGFKFSLGAGEVIKGWDLGVVGMKVGGKRRVTCPPHMAYGARGSPPTIPPNSTLVFDIELKSVH